MRTRIHTAKLMEPLLYLGSRAPTHCVPAGPCLVESIGGGRVLVTWGDEGQYSAVLPTDALQEALTRRQLEVLN